MTGEPSYRRRFAYAAAVPAVIAITGVILYGPFSLVVLPVGLALAALFSRVAGTARGALVAGVVAAVFQVVAAFAVFLVLCSLYCD